MRLTDACRPREGDGTRGTLPHSPTVQVRGGNNGAPVTVADARGSVARAKASLTEAAEEIVWQIEHEAWVLLDYETWNEMREAEYGEVAFIVPRKDRPELVARMRRAGLTQQEIADTAGVTEVTVRRDLSQSTNVDSGEPTPITNSRGRQRPAKYERKTDAPPKGDLDLVNDIRLYLRTMSKPAWGL